MPLSIQHLPVIEDLKKMSDMSWDSSTTYMEVSGLNNVNAISTNTNGQRTR